MFYLHVVACCHNYMYMIYLDSVGFSCCICTWYEDYIHLFTLTVFSSLNYAFPADLLVNNYAKCR